MISFDELIAPETYEPHVIVVSIDMLLIFDAKHGDENNTQIKYINCIDTNNFVVETVTVDAYKTNL